ncbi:MAG: leucine--tRNA ligase [Leptospiraceae bacterium]|nr:leucine--tRNA ligase [Leptospiraceae bacterium]MCK6381523.1 leucine--tRNA ligase [Leptospiraceae bacterium]NUM40662.1 leucine--tRNA ligase [Leptospiraceae bacterium]
MDYPFKQIEEKWQRYWEDNKTFLTDEDESKEKFYCLDMFPYPSGAGLHVGHPEGYTATDIISRYKRMQGFRVLHPMGWDSFGLPAERYAMTTGIHPSVTTKSNIDNFKKQIKMLGLSYDWEKEIATSDSKYYKFTQVIFLKIYNSYYDIDLDKGVPIRELISEFEKNGSKKVNSASWDYSRVFSEKDWKNFSSVEKETILSDFRLVYIANIPVNWCEGLGTVLANEEVEEWVGKGYTVVRKPMRQYMMRITAYSDRLLQDLDLVSWPQSTLEMQKNWIGKSRGIEINFYTESGKPIRVFTTRPDTIFGVTYLVLSPEHPLVDEITTQENKNSVEEYKKATSIKSDLDRTDLNKDKTGVKTGSFAINPANNEKIPVWIGDYVLYGYGTGAIMAVPAHDTRDFEFAEKFFLPILQVIHSEENLPFDSKNSYCINSNSSEVQLNGLGFEESFEKISKWAESKKIGKVKNQYKLRDWLFARQRYWGEPIPLVHLENGETFSLSEDSLPLELPDLKEFKPSGTEESPLALAKNWLSYYDPKTGKRGRRETNTMPQWAGSCWYYLRFIDPINDELFCDPVKEKKWMPVDLYVGGAEHAVLHLLYSRFWHKVLFDLGYVSTPEPFKKLVHQGLILGEDKKKMSKSLGNVVNPDEVVKEYGADSLRLFEMFMGPLEIAKPWSTKGVEGIFRFLNRIWRLFHGKDGENFFVEDIEPNEKELKILHRTIEKVSSDIENLSFNTAISQMMIFVNELTPENRRPREILEKFVLILAPFAPHLAEELWEKLGNKKSLSYEKFPKLNRKFLTEDSVKIVVQVNGKLRGEFFADKNITEIDAIEKAKNLDKVTQFLQDKQIKKSIYIKEKLVNIVV